MEELGFEGGNFFTNGTDDKFFIDHVFFVTVGNSADTFKVA